MTIQQWDQILQIAVLVMTTVVIPVVGFYISQFLNHHAAILRNQRTAKAATLLVAAAEEIFPDSKNGPEKEDYVNRLLKQWFPFLTDDEIMALVHSSVLALHDDLNAIRRISSSPPAVAIATVESPQKQEEGEPSTTTVSDEDDTAGDNPPDGLSPQDKLL